MARWPPMPVIRYVAPTWNAAVVMPLEASAMTLTVASPARSRTRLRSPLAAFVGRVAEAAGDDHEAPRWPRRDRPRRPRRRSGSAARPSVTSPPAAGRISSWPYGAASGPVTATTVPAMVRPCRPGSSDGDPGGRVADREQRGRPECGRPRRSPRPVPTRRSRPAGPGSRPATSAAGVADVPGVGVATGRRRGARRVGEGDGDGPALGVGVGRRGSARVWASGSGAAPRS